MDTLVFLRYKLIKIVEKMIETNFNAWCTE